MNTKKTVNKTSLNKAHQRFDNKPNAVQHVVLFGVLYLGYQILDTFGWNTALAAVLVALVGATFTLQYYLKRQRLADRPVSTVRAASRGFVELQGHLKGEELTSPMTGQACTFWRMEFTAIDGNRDNGDRDLVATVFSKPYVEFADKTGSCWLRAEDADWQVKTNTENHRKAGPFTSKYESLLGEGFLVDWYVQTKLNTIENATKWKVVESVVTQDTTVFVSGHVQKRRSDETGFDGLSDETIEPSPENIKLANSPVIHVHQSNNDQTPQHLNRAWVGVLKQLEGGDPSQPLAGNQEVRVLTQGSNAKDVLEVYAGSKSNELWSLKIKQYLSFAVLVASLGVLAVVGPQQLPIAINDIKEFLFH